MCARPLNHKGIEPDTLLYQVSVYHLFFPRGLYHVPFPYQLTLLYVGKHQLYGRLLLMIERCHPPQSTV